MIGVLLYLWQLPQNIIGLCWWLISGAHRTGSYDGVLILEVDYMASVSLGRYVFVSRHSHDKEFTTKHELGHAKQSKYLGILYLLVIGIPSVLWVLARQQIAYLRRISYYSFYTESWANSLMGLKA